jgi:glycosyltransferase involved in cell wall biosynthesis
MLVVHDVYPDVAVAVGAIRPDGLVERVAGALARWPYRTMTSIVALTSDMAALIERRCPEVADKLAVIPNWADLDVISPSDADGKAFLHELGLTDRFVVQYSGNIGRSHGIEAIADVAERLRDDPQIRFLVVGSGAKRDWLVATIDEKRLTNVTVLPRQPRDALNGLLNGCDVGILAMVPGMLGISSPSRLYNIFAAGKPVFAMVDAHSHVADVVESEGVGWVMEPGDVDELERRIREAAADAIGVREKGTKARAVAEQQFSRDHITDEYARLVRDVMER